ncbi:PAS domain-containing protein [Parvibaculum sp.]|jgi:hypothetical protein|uniref:PAS domain-containing protein n=1 Tax=Parvibaculum sp. TaxID=2024848 RepID=UPI003C794947
MGITERTENSRKLELYWKSIRKPGEKIPPRSAFRVTQELAPLLPNLVIVEVLDNDLVFRLVGTALTRHQGIDITGKSYGDFSKPDQVARAVARAMAAHKVGCGLLTIHEEEYGHGLSSTVEVAAFPLRGDANGEVMMVLSATPIDRGLAPKSDTALFLRPLTHIEYIDLGFGVPDDAEVLKNSSAQEAQKS